MSKPKTVVASTPTTKNAIVKVGGKIRRTSDSVPAYVAPTMQANKIYYDRNIEANFTIDAEIWAFLFMECQEYLSKEISGYAYANKDNEIVWAAITSYGSAANVQTTHEDAQWANERCMAANGNVPNIQLHTHPTFNVYFSGTDISDICDTVDTMQAMSKTGRYAFMVYNQTSAIIRVVEWDEDGARYNDGSLILSGKLLDNGIKNEAISWTAPKGGTYSNSSSTEESYVRYINGDLFDEEYVYYSPQKGSGVSTSPRKPLRYSYFTWYKELSQLKDAFEKGGPMGPIISGLGYYSIRAIRENLINSNRSEVWQAMSKYLATQKSDDEAVGRALDEIIRLSNVFGGVDDIIMILNTSSWRTAEDCLAELSVRPETKDLAALLDAENYGICPPAIKYLMDENRESGNDKDKVKSANDSIRRSIPKSAKSFWDSWSDALDEWEVNTANVSD